MDGVRAAEHRELIHPAGAGGVAVDLLEQGDVDASEIIGDLCGRPPHLGRVAVDVAPAVVPEVRRPACAEL